MKHKSVFQSKAERAEHGVAPPGTWHSATCLAPRPVTVIVGDPAAWGSQRQLSWGPKRPGAFFSREPRQDSWGQAPAERSREPPGARVGATSAGGGWCLPYANGTRSWASRPRTQAAGRAAAADAWRTPWGSGPVNAPDGSPCPPPPRHLRGHPLPSPLPSLSLAKQVFYSNIFWSSFRTTEIAQKVQRVPIQPPSPCFPSILSADAGTSATVGQVIQIRYYEFPGSLPVQDVLLVGRRPPH